MSADPRAVAAFRRDLGRRVRERAHRHGTTPESELRQFVAQRVLARQFTASPDGWTLTGGQAMLARWPDARPTGGLDLIGIGGATRDELVDRYEAALRIDLGDHLTFERDHHGVIRHGRGARLSHTAYCAGQRVGQVDARLVPPDERRPHEDPETIAFPEQLTSTGAAGESPPLRVVSVVEFLARKVSGLHARDTAPGHSTCDACLPRSQAGQSCGTGEQPSRARDLVDILVVATKQPAAAARAALREKLRLRVAQGDPPRTPSRLDDPSPAWRETFRRYAAITPALPFATLEDALPTAREFLDPVVEQARVAAGPPQRVLVVTDGGGLPAPGGELTRALAGLPDVELTLLTVGEPAEHGDARVVSVPAGPGQSPRSRLLDIAANATPDELPGLPPQPTSFDAVAGHGRHAGYAAMLIRSRWYPRAALAHLLHQPSSRYAEARGWPQRGDEHHRLETALVRNADLVVGVGPMLAALGADMAYGDQTPPSLHQLVPGTTTLGEVADPASDGSLDLLFGGSVNDPVTGYDDLLATVAELTDRGTAVRLRVRGVRSVQLGAEQHRADQLVGRPGVVELLPSTTDPGELLGDYRWAQVAVMPSRVEAYGRIAAQAAAHGVPVLVNAESGIGELLGDPDRIPAHLGADSVVPDRGLATDRAGRVRAWASALDRLRLDYGRRRAAAGELAAVLRQYSWTDAARGLAQALHEAEPGAGRSTVQAALGVAVPVGSPPAVPGDTTAEDLTVPVHPEPASAAGPDTSANPTADNPAPEDSTGEADRPRLDRTVSPEPVSSEPAGARV